MRALIISDIHGNIDALLALEAELRVGKKKCDLVLVLGDLVDYGPAPAEVIAWARENAHHVVRGNHDDAMATGGDCQSSPAYRALSVITREYFRARLDAASMQYLRALPLRVSVEMAGRKVEMVHATPRNPLFEYLGAEAEEARWKDALGTMAESASLILLGHTHIPFIREIGHATVVNPGSLGQPKDGDPRGCYALVEDGRVELRRVAYDVESAITRLHCLDLPEGCIEDLAWVLQTGGARHRSV
jgi:putative phosphoesterase